MKIAVRHFRRPLQRLMRTVAFMLAVFLVCGAVQPARAGSLDDIRARGTLIVGTKADYRPFGFHDDVGTIVGFEPDLAGEIAKALGVSVKLVPVVASTRISLLQSGDLDLVIATMNVTPERRAQVDFIEPSYYASGVNVLAPKSAHLRVWQELSGKPVCSVEGAFYLPEVQSRYNPDLHTYKNTGEIYAAVRAGRCIAVYDDTALIGELQTLGWGDYEMPLRSVLLQPWGIAVQKGNTELAAFVGDLVKKWHADGHVQRLEETWHIPPSVFAEQMHRRYTNGE
jgi:polar amino acid transport system substrate-binding protein